MKLGDIVIFHHSNTNYPAIVTSISANNLRADIYAFLPTPQVFGQVQFFDGPQLMGDSYIYPRESEGGDPEDPVGETIEGTMNPTNGMINVTHTNCVWVTPVALQQGQRNLDPKFVALTREMVSCDEHGNYDDEPAAFLGFSEGESGPASPISWKARLIDGVMYRGARVKTMEELVSIIKDAGPRQIYRV